MPIFVVHKHFATHLHWDLRIEMDGALKSWALPKEPMDDPKVRRLAISVQDHELSYADFEGNIPKGEYGAGTVQIWDKGECSILDRKDFKLIIDFQGNKLKGEYVLVQMKERQWLFFKKK